MKKQNYLIVLLIMLMAFSCGKDITDAPKPNQPPQTYLTFYPDGDLATTQSRQYLHWWADDPDGKVVKFIYTWDTQASVPEKIDEVAFDTWDTTSAYSDTFSLKFSNLDTTYTFRISAVDDEGLVDPTPAVQAFPIANSQPIVEFVVGTEIPETTFTVASFYWTGTDLDGDDTIEKYEYVLDDTMGTWQSISADSSFLDLKITDEFSNQDHVFYLRAVDIAGVASPIIRMPKKESEIWHVRKPVGNTLIIDDYEVKDANTALYTQALDSIGAVYSVWNIKLNRNGDTKYDLMPSSVDMFTETMLLFDRIIWYTDDNPHFEEAQIAIARYLKYDNRKIIFSTKFKEFFSEQGDPLEFSPIDSLGKTSFDVLPGMIFEFNETKANFPKLKASAWIPFVKGLIPKISAQFIYRLEENSSFYSGQPVMAAVDAENTFYFFGVPIHQLNGNKNVKKLIATIMNDEFGNP